MSISVHDGVHLLVAEPPVVSLRRPEVDAGALLDVGVFVGRSTLARLVYFSTCGMWAASRPVGSAWTWL